MDYSCADSHDASMCRLSSGLSCWPYSQQSGWSSMHPLCLFFIILKSMVISCCRKRALHPLSVTFSFSVLEGLYPERFISSLVPRVKTTEDWRSEYHCCFAYCMTWEEERRFVCRVRYCLGTSFVAAVYSLQLIGLCLRWCDRDPPYVRLVRAWLCIQPQSRWRC